MAVIIVALVLSSPTEVDRVNRLGSIIMCPVCQGESIASSPSDMARDMMSLVGERVDQGATDQQIIDELLGSFTGAVLLDPPVSGPTLILWLAPLIALIAGVVVIWWWRRNPGDDDLPSQAPGRTRKAVGALAMIGAVAAIVISVGFFLQERDPALGGVVPSGATDLEDYSNETLEAVIATFSDNPQIDGMRLALAERYVRIGDYRSAFPHYLSVASSEIASEAETAEALFGLAWMAWDGNREAEAAIGLIDQALELAPRSFDARYLKAQILWCGSGQPDQAAVILEALSSESNLPSEFRTVVDSDLAATRAGESCA